MKIAIRITKKALISCLYNINKGVFERTGYLLIVILSVIKTKMARYSRFSVITALGIDSLYMSDNQCSAARS